MTRIRNRSDGADPTVRVVEEACYKGCFQNLMIIQSCLTELIHLLLINVAGMRSYVPCILAKRVVLFGQLILGGTIIIGNLIYQTGVLPHTAEIVAVGGQAVTAAMERQAVILLKY